MMKKILLIAGLLIGSLTTFADAASAKDKQIQKDQAEIARLTALRLELVSQKQKKQAAAINNDPRLKRLQTQILKLAAELSRELEAKRDIRKYSEAIEAIDIKIKKIKNK